MQRARRQNTEKRTHENARQRRGRNLNKLAKTVPNNEGFFEIMQSVGHLERFSFKGMSHKRVFMLGVVYDNVFTTWIGVPTDLRKCEWACFVKDEGKIHIVYAPNKPKTAVAKPKQ